VEVGGSGLTVHSGRYLSATKFMLQFEWDHFINLSEVDFPVMPINSMISELRKKRGYSFLNANFDKTVQERGETINRQVSDRNALHTNVEAVSCALQVDRCYL
jgi:hypothetical protein